MPETYDFSRDTQPSELDAHMAQVHQFLQKVNNGRQIKGMDPNQPAFSPEAETIRQAAAVDKANQASKNHPVDEPAAPTSYDFSQGDTNPQAFDFGSTGGNVGPSTGTSKSFHPGQILDYLMNPVDPGLRQDIEGVTGKSGLEFLQPSTWTPRNIGKSLVGGTADALSTPMSYLLSPFVGKGVTAAKGLLPPIIPRPITQDQLGNLVAERAQAGKVEQAPPVVSPDLGVTPAKAGQAAPVTPMVEPSLVPQAGQVSPAVTAPAGTMVKAPTTQAEPAITPTSTSQQSLFTSNKSMPPEGGQLRPPLHVSPPVYHGTNSVFENMNTTTGNGIHGQGAYFTTDAGYASGFAREEGGNVRPARIELSKPLNLRDPADPQLKDHIREFLDHEGLDPEDLAQHQHSLSVAKTQGELHRVLLNAIGTNKVNRQLQAWGYDGLFRKYSDTRTDYVVFQAPSIKPLYQLFDHPAELRASQPLAAQMGDAGKTVAQDLAEQGVTLPHGTTVGNSLDGVAYPNLYARTSGSIIDAARTVGPVGDTIATLGDNAYSIRAMRSSQQALKATEAIDQVFGRTTLGQRIKVRAKMFSEGENAALTGERTIWGVTEAQEEQAFNHLYTNGRMPTTDPKAQGLADAAYKHLGYPASADPDVRALKGVLNPFTGKYTPFGEPGKFMPQQPIHPITADAIKDSQWRILYERKGGEKLGISLETFKSTIVKLSQHNPEVTAGKAQGLENMRLLDLEALGGSPYQWAKKLGYETDVFRAMFRYHSLATLRGQLGRIEGPINELLMSIPAKDAQTAEWLSKAASHILLKPSAAFDTTTRMTNGIKAASHLMDVTMLQKGMLANVAQAAYIGARGGLRATGKGMLDLLTGTDRALIEQSGANFPALMNELTTPTGPMARWSSIAYRLYGLSMIDRNTRYFAGHVGNRFVQQVEGNLLKNPQSTRLQGLIKELGGDPKVLLEQGKLPDDMRLQMIQRFANYTSGVTDVRGLPLWASSQNPWFKLVNKYRSFAASNSGEIRRAIFNAPTAYDGTKRAVTLLLGAYGLGSGIKIVGTDLINSIMGNEPKQSKASVWNKIEPLIYGLGTIEGMLVVNAAQDPTRAALSLTGGPLAGAAVNFADDLKATAEHGIGWRSIRAAASRLPIVGPFTGGYVKGQAKQQNASEAADRQQLAP